MSVNKTHQKSPLDLVAGVNPFAKFTTTFSDMARSVARQASAGHSRGGAPAGVSSRVLSPRLLQLSSSPVALFHKSPLELGTDRPLDRAAEDRRPQPVQPKVMGPRQSDVALKRLENGETLEHVSSSMGLDQSALKALLESEKNVTVTATAPTGDNGDVASTTLTDRRSGKVTTVSHDHQHDSRTTIVEDGSRRTTSRKDGNGRTSDTETDLRTGRSTTTIVDPKAGTERRIVEDGKGGRTETVRRLDDKGYWRDVRPGEHLSGIWEAEAKPRGISWDAFKADNPHLFANPQRDPDLVYAETDSVRIDGGGGETTHKVTANGHTLTRHPDGRLTLGDENGGSAIPIMPGSAQEGLAMLLLGADPDSTDLQKAKEGEIITAAVGSLLNGDALPALSQAVMIRAAAKDRAIADYEAGRPAQDALDTSGAVIGPFGKPPSDKPPSKVNWTPMLVGGGWKWFDPKVADAITAENLAVTQYNEAEAKAGRYDAQLDVYLLDPAFGSAAREATRKVQNVLAFYDKRLPARASGGTLAEAQKRLASADRRLDTARQARSAYEQGRGELLDAIAARAQLPGLEAPDAKRPVDQGISAEYFADPNASARLAHTRNAKSFTAAAMYISKGDKLNADYWVDLADEDRRRLERDKPGSAEHKAAVKAHEDMVELREIGIGETNLAGAYHDYAERQHGAAVLNWRAEPLKQRILEEYFGNDPRLQDPNGFTVGGDGAGYKGMVLRGEGKGTGRMVEAELKYSDDGQISLHIEYENSVFYDRERGKGGTKVLARTLTFPMSEGGATVRAEYRDRPANREWQALIDSARPVTRDIKAEADGSQSGLSGAKARILGLQIHQVDALRENAKSRSVELMTARNDALKLYQGGAMEMREGVPEPGEQTVEIKIQGYTLGVSPEIAELYERDGIQALGASDKVVRIEIDGRPRWVHPYVAAAELDRKAAEDESKQYEKWGRESRSSMVAEQGLYRQSAARFRLFGGGGSVDHASRSEYIYFQEQRDKALARYRGNLERLHEAGVDGKFRLYEGDALESLAAEALNVDRHSEIVQDVVGEIRDRSNGVPEVRVVPIFALDGGMASGSALFAVKKDGREVGYVDASGKYHEHEADKDKFDGFQHNNRLYSEQGHLIVPRGGDMALGDDGVFSPGDVEMIAARKVSTGERIADATIGIVGAAAEGVALLFPLARPLAQPIAMGTGLYLGGKQIKEEFVDHWLVQGGNLDEQSFWALAGGLTISLPMAASVGRGVGLRRTGMSWGHALAGGFDMASASGRGLMSFGGALPSEAAVREAMKTMRGSGSRALNRTILGLDAGGLLVGLPLLGQSLAELIERGGDMSLVEIADSIVGLSMGTIGTGLSIRGLMHDFIGGDILSLHTLTFPSFSIGALPRHHQIFNMLALLNAGIIGGHRSPDDPISDLNALDPDVAELVQLLAARIEPGTVSPDELVHFLNILWISANDPTLINFSESNQNPQKEKTREPEGNPRQQPVYDGVEKAAEPVMYDAYPGQRDTGSVQTLHALQGSVPEGEEVASLLIELSSRSVERISEFSPHDGRAEYKVGNFRVRGNPVEINWFHQAITYLENNSSYAREIIRESESNGIVRIYISGNISSVDNDFIVWNPLAGIMIDDEIISPSIILIHEIAHSNLSIKNRDASISLLNAKLSDGSFKNAEELRATVIEGIVAEQIGEKVRENYMGGIIIPVYHPLSRNKFDIIILNNNVGNNNYETISIENQEFTAHIIFALISRSPLGEALLNELAYFSSASDELTRRVASAFLHKEMENSDEGSRFTNKFEYIRDGLSIDSEIGIEEFFVYFVNCLIEGNNYDNVRVNNYTDKESYIKDYVDEEILRFSRNLFLSHIIFNDVKRNLPPSFLEISSPQISRAVMERYHDGDIGPEQALRELGHMVRVLRSGEAGTDFEGFYRDVAEDNWARHQASITDPARTKAEAYVAGQEGVHPDSHERPTIEEPGPHERRSSLSADHVPQPPRLSPEGERRQELWDIPGQSRLGRSNPDAYAREEEGSPPASDASERNDALASGDDDRRPGHRALRGPDAGKEDAGQIFFEFDDGSGEILQARIVGRPPQRAGDVRVTPERGPASSAGSQADAGATHQVVWENGTPYVVPVAGQGSTGLPARDFSSPPAQRPLDPQPGTADAAQGAPETRRVHAGPMVPDEVAARVDPEFAARVKDRIEAEGGQITFRDFMDYALYGIDGYGGYYNSGDVTISADAADNGMADFGTSPEGSKYFGHTVANAISDIYRSMGSPARFDIVETGAGNGTLAKTVLDWLREAHPDVYAAVNYVILERGKALIERQKQTLGDHEVQWVHGSAYEMPLRDVQGVFLSNEVPDAFPVHQAVVRGGTLKEIYVSVDENGQIVEVEGDLSPDLEQNLGVVDQLVPGWSSLPDGQRITVNLAAADWIRKMGNALQRGGVIAIDYGANNAALREPYSFFRQKLPVDVAYAAPGAIDITSWVDFEHLMATGREVGLEPSTLPRQKALSDQNTFLKDNGFLDLIKDAEPTEKSRAKGMTIFGSAFQVLVQQKNLDPSKGAMPRREPVRNLDGATEQYPEGTETDSAPQSLLEGPDRLARKPPYAGAAHNVGPVVGEPGAVPRIADGPKEEEPSALQEDASSQQTQERSPEGVDALRVDAPAESASQEASPEETPRRASDEPTPSVDETIGAKSRDKESADTGEPHWPEGERQSQQPTAVFDPTTGKVEVSLPSRSHAEPGYVGQPRAPTESEVRGLTSSEIGKLTGPELRAIPPHLLALLTKEQFLGLTPEQFAELTLDQLLALRKKHWRCVTADHLNALKPRVLAKIPPRMVPSIPTEAVAGLSVEHVRHLMPEQVAKLTPDQLAAMDVEQLWAIAENLDYDLGPAQLSKLDEAQKTAIESGEPTHRRAPPLLNVARVAMYIVLTRVSAATFGHVTGAQGPFNSMSGPEASTAAYYRSALSKYAWYKHNHAMIDVFERAAQGRKDDALALLEKILDRSGRRGALPLNKREAADLRKLVAQVADAGKKYQEALAKLDPAQRGKLPPIKIRKLPTLDELSNVKTLRDLAKADGVAETLAAMAADRNSEYYGQRPETIIRSLAAKLEKTGNQEMLRQQEMLSDLLRTAEAKKAYKKLHKLLNERFADKGDPNKVDHKATEKLTGSSMSPDTWLGYFFKLGSFGGAFNVLLAWGSKGMPKDGSWADWAAYSADPVGVAPAVWVQWKYLKALREITDYKAAHPYPRTPEQEEKLAELETKRRKWNTLADFTSLASAARNILVGIGYLKAGDYALASGSFTQALSSIGWVLVQQTPKMLSISPKTKLVMRYSAIALGAAVPTAILLTKLLSEDEEETDPSVFDRLFDFGDGVLDDLRDLLEPYPILPPLGETKRFDPLIDDELGSVAAHDPATLAGAADDPDPSLAGAYSLA
ncbi:SAM-dependent methyltransferase [Nitratireductor pacificus]|uniref:LysM domain-containing protein n=1 Tax=Nitratireductor pacificus pht-3B TaxID=391937 RepID=K2MKC3_9HYPH|nr:SAM-dependent methyltransferase [Nitratireductor pacificus]EKF17672.1 hypothetical protein NA2_16472 [Nitratireductor pacificus pht-3B]